MTSFFFLTEESRHAGGAAVLLDAWLPVVSVPLAAILLVAHSSSAITVHWQYGFSSIKLRAVTVAGPQFGPPGYETDLLYLTALATLVLGGPGPLSIDRRFGQWRRNARNNRQPIDVLCLTPWNFLSARRH